MVSLKTKYRKALMIYILKYFILNHGNVDLGNF